jgi:hypothetical protein
MDNSIDQSKLKDNRGGILIAASQTIRSFFSWMAGFFILTDEERKEAGIYSGGEGRDG